MCLHSIKNMIEDFHCISTRKTSISFFSCLIDNDNREVITVRWTKNGWHFYNNIYGFDHFNRTIFDSVFDLTWFFEVRNIFSKTNEVDKEMIVKMLLSLMKLTIRTKKIHIWNLPRKFIFCVITAMTPECFILKWKGLVLLRFVYG